MTDPRAERIAKGWLAASLEGEEQRFAALPLCLRSRVPGTAEHHRRKLLKESLMKGKATRNGRLAHENCDHSQRKRGDMKSWMEGKGYVTAKQSDVFEDGSRASGA